MPPEDDPWLKETVNTKSEQLATGGWIQDDADKKPETGGWGNETGEEKPPSNEWGKEN